MNDYKFRVEFLEEAKTFLDGLDEKARDKIVYNIWKARSTNDKKLFKKLQDEIWYFRTKVQQNVLSTLCVLGQDGQKRYHGYFNLRIDKENGQSCKK